MESVLLSVKMRLKQLPEKQLGTQKEQELLAVDVLMNGLMIHSRRFSTGLLLAKVVCATVRTKMHLLHNSVL